MDYLDPQKIILEIKEKTDNSPEMVYREIKVLDYNVNLVFNESVSSSTLISDFVVKSIENTIINSNNAKKNNSDDNNIKIVTVKRRNRGKESTNNKDSKFLYNLLLKELYFCKVKEIDIKKDDLFYYIYSGFTLVILDTGILALETKDNLNRNIAEPSTEGGLKGPKDSFTENYMQNIGLIRKRIKTEKLKLLENRVGRRTKTKVGILYISDICKSENVKKLEEKIKKIDIDGVLDSNTIAEICISGSNTTVFPTIISTERPDLVSSYLLQGRIIVMVENSPFALVFPAFISDFFKHMDDYYQKSNTVVFIRLIRYLAFFITLFTPAIYIALTTFNQEAIPTDLLISFAIQRDGVPAPAFIEAMLMIICFEILREGDFRVPSLAGSTLSIVGALILGEAAVSAGIVSPIMIIVIAITTISGLIFSDINMVSALRTWRIVFLVFAALAGIIGIIVATFIFIIKLVSIDSDNMPYTYPFAPVDITEISSDTITRENVTRLNKRKKILTNNLTKYRASEVTDK